MSWVNTLTAFLLSGRAMLTSVAFIAASMTYPPDMSEIASPRRASPVVYIDHAPVKTQVLRRNTSYARVHDGISQYVQRWNVLNGSGRPVLRQKRLSMVPASSTSTKQILGRKIISGGAVHVAIRRSSNLKTPHAIWGRLVNARVSQSIRCRQVLAGCYL